MSIESFALRGAIAAKTFTGAYCAKETVELALHNHAIAAIGLGIFSSLIFLHNIPLTLKL